MACAASPAAGAPGGAGSFSDSDASYPFTAYALTVRATLRKQTRSILEFVLEACRARLFELDPPSLLQPNQSMDRHIAAVSEAA